MVDTRATGASADGAVGRGGGAIPAVVNVEAEASDASDGIEETHPNATRVGSVARPGKGIVLWIRDGM